MDITNTLIIALVCAAIGYIAGLMISSTRREPEQKPGGSADPTLMTDPAYLPVAHLVRDTMNGPLIVNVEGRYYRVPGEMNPAMRTSIEELTIELHSWLGYPLAPGRGSAAAETEDAPVLEAMPVAAAVPVPVPVSEPARVSGKSGPLPASPPAPAPSRPPQSIVEEIDAILQENIAGTAYMGRGIRLVETPTRGVAVRIGLDLFQLDEVPEAEIRTLIRAAVAEWELQAK